MKYFVFRNMTIESIFASAAKEVGANIAYSGYEDISDISPDANLYVWWYIAPYDGENKQIADIIDHYIALLDFTLQQIDSYKTVIALTMVPVFEVNCITSGSLIKLAINKYNQTLYTLAEKHENLKVIDFSSFTGSYVSSQLIDWKYYFISQMAINPRISKDFGVWFGNQVRAINLNRKKCLVLDLDNTLWGGIVGEDGVHGIMIGGDYPGNAYRYFQRHLLDLQRQGIILTVCSKNNLNDIVQVWSENQNNLIKEDSLSAYRINWQDKATNIVELAQELNIGIDSMVFIDDNPTERELIKRMLPEVIVPDFPEHPYNLPPFIAKIAQDYFSIYHLTQEDKAKTEQYKANAERKMSNSLFSDMREYLFSLEMKLIIEPASPITIERVAQMTQKTNQFNLTTRRYTESDIESMLVQGAKIWTLSVSDRFGDNGITGLLIAKIDNSTATIDTLLLSCRILGKGIEVEFVKYILHLLKNSGIEQVVAEYISTVKNGQVADFYTRLGFESINENTFQISLLNFDYTQNSIYTIQ